MDPEYRVAQAIATHETWSGLTVGWPIGDTGERLVIELSGLPVFDRARAFRGYRGFGVCRDLSRLCELAQQRGAATPAAVTVDEAAATPAAPGEPLPSPATAPPAENVVPFPAAAADANGPALSPIERRAFRELSRRLTQHLNHSDAAPDDRNGGWRR